MSDFELDSYQYDLPGELIAKSPVTPRDASRLLVVDRSSGSIEHHQFSDIKNYLDQDDLLVANNTKVLKARLLGHRLKPENDKDPNSSLVPGGKVEFLLVEELAPNVWEGMFHASAKHKPGLQFEIPRAGGKPLRGELVKGTSESQSGTVIAKFDDDPVELGLGEIPLPPYIDRAPEHSDLERYQTVYAENFGSVAAPTAGLHFTPELIEGLKDQGVLWEDITLHVGIGTFRPVKTSDIRKHVMHEERYEILPQTAQNITEFNLGGKRVVAVGTTSVRTLESAWTGQRIKPGHGRTNLFIHPGGQKFQVVDRMITNFHLPGSTLLMLVSAFAGRDLVMKAYREAVKEKYRFYSYGDAMLIL